jgi:molybdate transport system ATP-binding protein
VVIALRDVTVSYGGRAVLDRVSWTVRRGERWALLGPNGSGKSTLLSLVCGDHPQAYGNDVSVFGRRRGTGESIWDVKRRIGLVSPELHLYFTHPMTARTAAATGFFDVVTPRPTTPEQNAAVGRLFAEFGLSDVANRPFARLSTGQQRLVLLVRALVKEPELLILDEPFQGLDRPAVDHARAWLDANPDAAQTLIFVSHYPDEVPASVTRTLRLDAGRVAEVA